MKTDYVYPEDVLPEIEYVHPKVLQENCGNCGHTYITNKNAIR